MQDKVRTLKADCVISRLRTAQKKQRSLLKTETPMFKILPVCLLLLIGVMQHGQSQSIEILRKKIAAVLSEKNAHVGVAIMDANGGDTLSFNGDGHFPLQSVFKFHIALVVLTEVDKGKLSLQQKIRIDKKELLPGLYSPLRNRYPNGTSLPIAELIQYSVSQSDNVACDVLLKLLGGPLVVQQYFAAHQFKDVSIKINEEVQQGNWDLQFQNWTTPKASNAILKAFYDNRSRLLSKASHAFVWKTMKETTTGRDRLKALLPANTIVAHKTGSSGTNKAGLTAAVNDIGVVFARNGQHYFISVFVTNSKENDEANAKIIADISKLAWEYFNAAGKHVTSK